MKRLFPDPGALSSLEEWKSALLWCADHFWADSVFSYMKGCMGVFATLKQLFWQKTAETTTSSANKGATVVAAERKAWAVWCTDTGDPPALPSVWGCGVCCRLTLTATAKTWADKTESSSCSNIFAMILNLNAPAFSQGGDAIWLFPPVAHSTEWVHRPKMTLSWSTRDTHSQLSLFCCKVFFFLTGNPTGAWRVSLALVWGIS